MSSPVRVAMITQAYYPHLGGAERQLAALAPLLQSQGCEVHILTRRYPGLAPFEVVQGIPVHRLPIPGPKAVASMIFTMGAILLLHQLRPHIIHAHELFSPTTTAITAKRLLGAPVVVKILRGGTLGDIARLKRKILGQHRLATFRKNVDIFVSISQEISAELAALNIPAERRPFIPNGVDIEHFKPLTEAEKQALRRSFGLPDGPIAVFAGRLAPEKRIDQLIKIWPVVRKAHPGALLLLVGTGPEEALLKQAAGAGVLFAGQTDDVAPFLQAADLFVLPSVAEGLSNALLEAMASGLPAVATSVGGACDLIKHGYNGLLVPPDCPPALQEAILMLLDDRQYRAGLSERSRTKVVQNYALPVVARQLQALYNRLKINRPSDLN